MSTEPPTPKRPSWIKLVLLSLGAIVALAAACVALNSLAGGLALRGEFEARRRYDIEQCTMACGLAADDCMARCDAGASACREPCMVTWNACRRACGYEPPR